MDKIEILKEYLKKKGFERNPYREDNVVFYIKELDDICEHRIRVERDNDFTYLSDVICRSLNVTQEQIFHEMQGQEQAVNEFLRELLRNGACSKCIYLGSLHCDDCEHREKFELSEEDYLKLEERFK